MPSFLLPPSVFYFCVPQVDLKPISVYHLMTEEVSTAMGIPMEGFFDGADVVARGHGFCFCCCTGGSC